MKKLKYLLLAIPLGLGTLFYNLTTNNPHIVEKTQKFENVEIINYSTIETGVKYFSDLNQEKTKVIACEKYFKEDKKPFVTLIQKNKYESYGNTLIIGEDTVQTDLINTVPNTFLGHHSTYDNFKFTQKYFFEGNLSLKEIRSKLNEGDYIFSPGIIINGPKDEDLRNSIKDSLCLNQVKKSLDYMIENTDEIFIDSSKKYVPFIYESMPLDSVCNKCLEEKL